MSKNSSHAASIKVKNQTGGDPVTDAIVTVNGVTLSYDSATQSYADAVKAVDSKIVFSVSWVHSPHMDGAMHVYRKMGDGVL